MEFLMRFDFEIIYIKGESNLVADALSQYYESDLWNEQPDTAQYINMDSQLDPEGEDLPWDQFEEGRAMHMTNNEPLALEHPQRLWHAPRRLDDLATYTTKWDLIEAVELRQTEVVELAAHEERNLCPRVTDQSDVHPQDDPWVIDSFNKHVDLHLQVEGDLSFLKDIQNTYGKDPLFKKVLEAPGHYKNFEIKDDLLYMQNLAKECVLCNTFLFWQPPPTQRLWASSWSR